MRPLSAADTIFLGGDIITMDERNPSVQALAVRDGRIIAVGNLEDIVSLHTGEGTAVVNLNKQTLLPGLIEPHQHAVLMALHKCMFINISGYDHATYEEIRMVMVNALARRESWCVFFGWDAELVRDLPVLTADFLDREFSSEIPICVWGQSGHVLWANHKALEAAGIDESVENPDEGAFVRDKDGKLTGQMLGYAAAAQVIHAAPLPSSDEIFAAVKQQWKEYAERGFTTVTDLYYEETDEFNVALNRISKQDTCPIRVALYLPNLQDSKANQEASKCCRAPFSSPETANVEVDLEENEKLWVQGFKIVADGSPHCGTIATREPLIRSNFTEVLGFPLIADGDAHQNYSWDEMYNMVKFSHDSGKHVAVHAHGERAIDRVISVFEKLLENDKMNPLRHRMEHLGLMTEDQIVRACKINLSLSFFVGHLYFYAKTYSEFILGRERTNRWSPLSLAVKHNVRWSLHQDHPTFPGSPQAFESIRTAVTRTRRGDDKTVYGPEYRVSVHEALKAYTITAAWQLNRDGELGSLEVGKRADLVILSDNPYNVDPFTLQDIKVVNTYIDGRDNHISAP